MGQNLMDSDRFKKSHCKPLGKRDSRPDLPELDLYVSYRLKVGGGGKQIFCL